MSDEGQDRGGVVGEAKAVVGEARQAVGEAVKGIQKSGDRYGKAFSAASEKAPPKIVPYLKMLAPFVGKFVAFLEVVTPIVVRACMKAYDFFAALPHNILQMILGLVLCFFGGLYPLLVSSAEAAKLVGGDRMYDAINTLVDQGKIIMQESKKDDALDEDHDGTADVDQISGQDLVLRKTKLFLRKCNPALIQSAFGALYVSWIAIIAALRVEYARTVALAVTIGNMLRRPGMKFGLPVLDHVVPPDYHKWNEVIIDTLCKVVGISIAWFIQRVLSTVQSALRGANMFTMALIRFLKGQGKLPAAFDAKDSWMDEAVAWSLAAAGVYFQIFVISWTLPFPFNLVLFPFSMAEGWMQWSVTYPPPAAVA